MMNRLDPAPRNDSGGEEVNLSRAIQIPPHAPVSLRIEGSRRWPASCHVKVLAIRKLDDETLDFHCGINLEEFTEQSAFVRANDRPVVRFFVGVDGSGACQITQIINQRNEGITLKDVDTQAAVAEMVKVLPAEVQRAVQKFFENLRRQLQITAVQSEVGQALDAAASPEPRAKKPLVEERIALRAPNRPSLVLDDQGNEIETNVKIIQLGTRPVEYIEAGNAVILRSGKEELGDDALDQCEDFGGVVLGSNGEVIRVTGADGVGSTQAPASTARVSVAAALAHAGGDPKDAIVAADQRVQDSCDVSALIKELDSMGIPRVGARYRSIFNALNGKYGRGGIGAATLLAASVSERGLEVARLGDMGAGVITRSGQIFAEAENVQAAPDQISARVRLTPENIAQATLPFGRGDVGIVFSDGLLKRNEGTLPLEDFLRKVAAHLKKPDATLSEVGKQLMAEMNGQDDGWLCLFGRS